MRLCFSAQLQGSGWTVSAIPIRGMYAGGRQLEGEVMLWKRGVPASRVVVLAGLGLAAFLAVVVAPAEAGQRPRPADLVLHSGEIETVRPSV